jgi:hypothetical protein
MGSMEGIGKFGHAVSNGFRWFLRFFWLSLVGLAIYASFKPAAPPHIPTAQELREAAFAVGAKERDRQKLDTERNLCRRAAACKKYDQVRLECATAGSFKTCMRIKMGDEAQYGDLCSGYNEDGPALQLDPNTPDVVRCFFLNNF